MPPGIQLDNTMGAALVGVIVAATLHGVTVVQGWYYFTHQKDRWPLKLLVAAVLFFETIHQALISHTVYSYLVTNFDDPLMLGNLVWSIVVEVLFNGLTALLVQSFLTMRVWRLSNHHIWLTGSVLLLVVGEFACVVAYTSKSLQLETYAQLAVLKDLSIVVNALAAAGDVLIAASLCIMLHRSRTGFQRSDTMINRLILFSVNTGFLTSLCAVASLVSIVVAGNTFLYIAFYFCLGRLYSNSLLATLNARKKIRNAVDGINTTSDNMSLSLRDMPKSTISSKVKSDEIPTIAGSLSQHYFGYPQGPTNISIKIDTTKELTSDHVSDHDHTNSSKPPSFSFKEVI